MSIKISIILLAFILLLQNAEAQPPTHADLAYGTHQRHKLDLWAANQNSQQPSPVLVCIHGGGFRRGDKSKFARDTQLLKTMLDAGISVVAINYRHTDGGANPYPAPMLDAARAIQFLRYSTKKYHLDTSRIICTGGSAGGCMSLWLAFHDDLADPNNADPILRQSTRITAAVPYAGQSSLHLPTILSWFQLNELVEHPGGRPLFGIPPNVPIPQTAEFDNLTRDASPITHLTADDPPVYMSYPPNQPVDENTEYRIWVHHPIFGIKLKQAMDQLGIENHLLIEKGPQPTIRTPYDFIIAKLTFSK